jgi:hypothetical protein
MRRHCHWQIENTSYSSMGFPEIEEAYNRVDGPLIVRREAWPREDYAEFDGDGIERRGGNGDICSLDEEDVEATDWVIDRGR